MNKQQERKPLDDIACDEMAHEMCIYGLAVMCAFNVFKIYSNTAGMFNIFEMRFGTIKEEGAIEHPVWSEYPVVKKNGKWEEAY